MMHKATLFIGLALLLLPAQQSEKRKRRNRIPTMLCV
jgi:hypothetical protein